MLLKLTPGMLVAAMAMAGITIGVRLVRRYRHPPVTPAEPATWQAPTRFYPSSTNPSKQGVAAATGADHEVGALVSDWREVILQRGKLVKEP